MGKYKDILIAQMEKPGTGPRINLDHLNYKIKKVVDFLRSQGHNPVVRPFIGKRYDPYFEALAILEEEDFKQIRGRTPIWNLSEAILRHSQFAIDSHSGEWIKQRVIFPPTLAEKVLYGNK